MLNNIALVIVRWLVNSTDPLILRDESASVARSAPIADGARLPASSTARRRSTWAS